MMSGLPYPSALLGDPKAKPKPLPTRQGPTWPHLQNATLPSLARPRGTLQTELPCCPHWASRAHSQDRVLAPRSATAGAGGTDKQGSSVVTRHLPAWNSVSPLPSGEPRKPLRAARKPSSQGVGTGVAGSTHTYPLARALTHPAVLGIITRTPTFLTPELRCRGRQAGLQGSWGEGDPSRPCLPFSKSWPSLLSHQDLAHGGGAEQGRHSERN